MLRGWAKFDYNGVDPLVEAGDCIHQRPGIVHSLYDWSDDMEFMEIIMPRDFATTEITPPAMAATAPPAAARCADRRSAAGVNKVLQDRIM